MGSYEIVEDLKELHYTGDGWQTIHLTSAEIQQFKKGTLDLIKVFNDGREVY